VFGAKGAITLISAENLTGVVFIVPLFHQTALWTEKKILIYSKTHCGHFHFILNDLESKTGP
jgi:hypothetical protein